MFDFDPAKSAANLAKHGIDFEQAQRLWDDDNGLLVQSLGRDEERWLLVARSGEQHWSAIYTLRDTVVRIISVRRARKNEVYDYDNR